MSLFIGLEGDSSIAQAHADLFLSRLEALENAIERQNDDIKFFTPAAPVIGITGRRGNGDRVDNAGGFLSGAGATTMRTNGGDEEEEEEEEDEEEGEEEEEGDDDDDADTRSIEEDMVDMGAGSVDYDDGGLGDGLLDSDDNINMDGDEEYMQEIEDFNSDFEDERFV